MPKVPFTEKAIDWLVNKGWLDDKAGEIFVKEFGTHVVVSAELGGKLQVAY